MRLTMYITARIFCLKKRTESASYDFATSKIDYYSRLSIDIIPRSLLCVCEMLNSVNELNFVSAFRGKRRLLFRSRSSSFFNGNKQASCFRVQNQTHADVPQY